MASYADDRGACAAVSPSLTDPMAGASASFPTKTTPPDPTPGSAPPQIVVLMGRTGTGKSTFINSVLGSPELEVGNNLSSCTTSIATRDFRHNGQMVRLVDTAGFDDTEHSDADILAEVVAYLSTSYRAGEKVAGIIYLQRITDIRIGGLESKNLRLFKKLVGEQSLRNVVLVSTQWSKLKIMQEGEDRERELSSKFWNDMISKGSVVRRFDHDRAEALSVLDHILAFSPTVLDVQIEVVIEKKDLLATSVGAALDEEYAKAAGKAHRDRDNLEQELREAQNMQEHAQITKELEDTKQQFLKILTERNALATVTATTLLQSDEVPTDKGNEGASMTGVLSGRLPNIETKHELEKQPILKFLGKGAKADKIRDWAQKRGSNPSHSGLLDATIQAFHDATEGVAGRVGSAKERYKKLRHQNIDTPHLSHK